jgi:AcrR family transcriptional regulator
VALTVWLAHANQSLVLVETRRPWLLSQADAPSKQRTLDAALTLFVRHGLAGTSIRMIAAEAGYTNPALFKFFPSKDALALHLFERCHGRVLGRLAPAAAGGFGTSLDRMIDAFLDLIDEDLEAVLFVLDSLRELWPRLPEAARRRSISAVLGDLVERGMREGAVVGYRSSDVPVAALVGLLAQLARVLYSGEIQAPARRHADELRLALTRMLAT